MRRAEVMHGKSMHGFTVLAASLLCDQHSMQSSQLALHADDQLSHGQAGYLPDSWQLSDTSICTPACCAALSTLVLW